jgi:hypothetical protein
MGRTPKSGQQIAFKPTKAMRAFIETLSQRNDISMSEVARRCADVYRALYEKLGGDWLEIEQRARMNEQAIGEILASLVHAGLDQERKSRK